MAYSKTTLRPIGLTNYNAGANAWQTFGSGSLNGAVSDDNDASYANAPYTFTRNLFPNGNGTQTLVTPHGAPTAWQCMQDNTNGTYITMGGKTAVCGLQMANLPALLPSETITGVQVGIAIAGYHTNLTIQMTVGGVTQTYAVWGALNYRSVANIASGFHTTQPNGQPWNPAAWNAAVLTISTDTGAPIYRAWIGVQTARPVKWLDLRMANIPGGLPPAGYNSFAIQPRLRCAQWNGTRWWCGIQLMDANQNYFYSAAAWIPRSGGPEVVAFPLASTVCNNALAATKTLWTPAQVNAGLTMRIWLNPDASTFRLYEAYLDVLWNAMALPPFNLSPQGNTEQMMPVLTWDYADPEGDVQQQAQVRLFTNAQHNAVGFNPATSVATWQMPITNTGKHSVVVGTALSLGTQYWWYVRVNSDKTRWTGYVGASITITAPPRITYVTTPGGFGSSAGAATPIPIADHGPPVTNVPVYASYINFDGNSDQYIYVVPQGCTRLMIDAWGGCGVAGADGDNTGESRGQNSGGSGGYVGRLMLQVSPGERLWISFNSITPGVGGQAASGSGAGTVMVGGDGGQAVDIRRGAFTIANRVIVVGGGGGGGGQGQDFYKNYNNNFGGRGGQGGDPASTGTQGTNGVNGAIAGYGANGQTPGQPGDSTPYTKQQQTQPTWAGAGTAPYLLPAAPQLNRFEDSEHGGDGGAGGFGDDNAIYPVFHTHPQTGGGGGGGGAGYPSGAGGGGGAQDTVSGSISPFYASGGGGGAGGSSWVAPEIRDYAMVPGMTYVTRGMYPNYSANRGTVMITPFPPVVTITSPSSGSDTQPIPQAAITSQIIQQAQAVAAITKAKLDVSGGLTVAWNLDVSPTQPKGQSFYSIRRRSILSTLHEYWNGAAWVQGEGLMDTPNNTWQPGGETFIKSSVGTCLTLGWVPGGTWAISVAVIDTSGAYSQYSDEVFVELQAQPNLAFVSPQVDANGLYYSQLLSVRWQSHVYSSIGDPTQLAYQLRLYSAGATQQVYFDPDTFVGDVYDSDLVFTSSNAVDLPIVLADGTSYVIYLRIAQNNMQWSDWATMSFTTAAFTNAPATLAAPNILVGMDNLDYLNAPLDETQYDTNGVYIGAVPVVDISLDTTDTTLWITDVQRSLDQITWTPVRLQSGVVTNVVQDFEFPPGQTVFYQVRVAGLCANDPTPTDANYSPPANGVAYSGWSVPQSVDIPQAQWAWFSDPLAPGSATPVMLQVGGAVYTTPERQAVYNVMGSAAPVIVADVIGYDTIALQVDMVHRPMMASFLAMQARQRVLCLQGNNDVVYVRLGGSFAKPYTTATIRQASGSATVVDMPIIHPYQPVVVYGGQAIELDSGNTHQ